MNIILLSADEIRGDDTVVLRDHRCEHIRKVLHCKCGAQVKVGVVNGRMGSGSVEEVTEQRVVLKITLDRPPPTGLPIDLILALPRPIMLRKILTQTASLGVKKIFLINANRVEKSFFQASLLQDRQYRDFFCHGLEQARDTVMPEISIHKRFRPFVEDLLPSVLGGYEHCLVGHPDAAQNICQSVGGPVTGRALLAVGPEGGWVDYEIGKFREQGFAVFTMGARILRVDTAVVALLSQLQLLMEMADF